jgi:hypothetical protein
LRFATPSASILKTERTSKTAVSKPTPLGYLAIAKRLNAAGEETRNGKAWNAAQVRRVLLEAPPAEPPLPFRAAA